MTAGISPQALKRRGLLIGAVGLVKGRVRELNLVMVEICDELEPLLQKVGFLHEAPFETVSLIFRLGDRELPVTEIQPINARYQELPISRTLALDALKKLDRSSLRAALKKVTLEALRDVSKKYSLPDEWLTAT